MKTCSNFEGMAKESVESTTKDMVDKPDLEQHVFFRVIEDCPDDTDVGCGVVTLSDCLTDLLSVTLSYFLYF